MKPKSEEDIKLMVRDLLCSVLGWDPNLILAEYSLAQDHYRIVPDKNRAEKVAPNRRDNRPDLVLFHAPYEPIAVILKVSNRVNG